MIKTAAQPCGWEWGFITIIEVIHFLYFYDTCALLNMGEAAFDEHFIISAQTLIELEDIKTSRKRTKQPNIRRGPWPTCWTSGQMPGSM